MRDVLNDENDSKNNGYNKKIEELDRINKQVENQLRIEKQKVSSIQLENQTLKDKVMRLTDNMKSMQYKDLMESKMNITTENYNKEIQNLEQTLQRYMNDNKRLTLEVSRMNDMSRNFDNSMIQATVDNEKRLFKAQKKNKLLMNELVEAKKIINDLEREKINEGHGVPFNLDESQIPFNPNQSQMRFGSGVKNNQLDFGKKSAPNDVAELGITKFLNDDLSFIQEQPDYDSKQSLDPNFNASSNNPFGGPNQSNIAEYRKQKELESKLNSTVSERDNLKLEISNLNNQLQVMRTELKHKEDTTNEKNLIRKLKIENEEIRKLAESLQKKNAELVRQKNSLRLRLNDLERNKGDVSGLDKSGLSMVNKTAGFLSSSSDSEKIENLKFKVKTLEETNLNLLKEVRQYKDANNKSMMSVRSNMTNIEYTILKEVKFKWITHSNFIGKCKAQKNYSKQLNTREKWPFQVHPIGNFGSQKSGGQAEKGAQSGKRE